MASALSPSLAGERARPSRRSASPVQGPAGLGVHRHLRPRPGRLSSRRTRRPTSARARRRRAALFDAAATLTGELPDGVIVTSLERGRREHPELLERHLGSLVDGDDVFVALNDAGFRGGAFVYVPRGVALERADPAHRGPGARPGRELHRRTLIVLEEGAQAEVWEQYLSARRRARRRVQRRHRAGRRRQRAPALRLRPGPVGAQLDLRRPARRGRPRRRLDWVALGFGSARGHVRMETRLAGEGADARVTGAYATHGRQHIDFDTTQEHAAPNTTSDLAFRGVLQGRSTRGLEGQHHRRPRRPEDRRLPGVAQPADLQARPRRRDPRPRDPGQRRPLHARRGGRPGRPRAAVLPALARAPRGRRQAAGDRGLPLRAGRALRGGAGARACWPTRSSAGSATCWATRRPVVSCSPAAAGKGAAGPTCLTSI